VSRARPTEYEAELEHTRWLEVQKSERLEADIATIHELGWRAIVERDALGQLACRYEDNCTSLRQKLGEAQTELASTRAVCEAAERLVDARFTEGNMHAELATLLKPLVAAVRARRGG
jgi:hypothetical protein